MSDLKCPDCGETMRSSKQDGYSTQTDRLVCNTCHGEGARHEVETYWRGFAKGLAAAWTPVDLDMPETLPPDIQGTVVIAMRGHLAAVCAMYVGGWDSWGATGGEWEWQSGDRWTLAPGEDATCQP